MNGTARDKDVKNRGFFLSFLHAKVLPTNSDLIGAPATHCEVFGAGDPGTETES